MGNKIEWKLLDIKLIIRLYTEDYKSTVNIAELFKVKHHVINKLLRKNNIKIRSVKLSYKLNAKDIKDKLSIKFTLLLIKNIIYLYTKCKKNIKSISEIYKVSSTPIKRVIKLNNVLKTKSLSHRRLLLNHQAFEFINEFSSYWLGFLMADGYVSDKNLVTLALAEIDILHIKSFKLFMKSLHKISYRSKTSSYAISFTSLEISIDLAKHGVVPRKSLNAKTSELLVFNKDFWRGMIDGDGTLLLSKSNPRIAPQISLLGSRFILLQFILFIKSIIPEFNQEVLKHKSIFNVRVKGLKAVTLIKYLYQDAKVALPRKALKARQIILEDWKTLRHLKEQQSIQQTT